MIKIWISIQTFLNNCGFGANVLFYKRSLTLKGIKVFPGYAMGYTHTMATGIWLPSPQYVAEYYFPMDKFKLIPQCNWNLCYESYVVCICQYHHDWHVIRCIGKIPISYQCIYTYIYIYIESSYILNKVLPFPTDVPDSKSHGANMGFTWVLSSPGRPHVGPMNLAIWGDPYSFLWYGTHSWRIYSNTPWAKIVDRLLCHVIWN